jgi:hypothetical protein
MERIDHEDASHLVAVAGTEDSRVQGPDTSAGEYPTVVDRLVSFYLFPPTLFRIIVTYGPSSPARESVSLRPSEAMLAENGDGAVSLWSFVSADCGTRKATRPSTYPRHTRTVSKAESVDRSVLDGVFRKLP